MKTYIIGHQKPDTDAVAAPLALAYLYQQQDCFGYPQPVAVISDPLNPETAFLFQKLQLNTPPLIKAGDLEADDQVVLADHNEASQRLADLNPEQIVEIVDHHKVNLDLNQPIFLTFKPWGATCTVVYYLMKRYQVKPEPKLAALMLAAILSDTVGLQGATTTDHDRQYATELAELAGIKDVPAFTLEIFQAKSNLASLSDEQIVQNDYKIFDFGGQKVMISQLETVEQTAVLANRKSQLLQAMQKIKDGQKLNLFLVVVSDVLKLNSKMLILGPAEQTVAESAFGGRVEAQVLDIGARMSRKKEIAPLVEKAVLKSVGK